MPEDLSKYGVIEGGDDLARYGVIDPLAPASPARKPGLADMALRAGGRTASNLWETAKGLGSLLTTNPATTFSQMHAAGADAIGRAREQFGRAAAETTPAARLSGFRRAIPPALGALPLIGPPLEQLAGDIQEGNWPEAVGDVASVAILPKIPAAVKGTARGVAKVAGKPGVAKGAGALLGGIGGHAVGAQSGIPWWLSGGVGAKIGRDVGGALERRLAKPATPPTPPAAPPSPQTGYSWQGTSGTVPQAKGPIQTSTNPNLKPTPPEVPPVGISLDDIARSTAGKNYSKLTPSEQAGVQKIAEAAARQKAPTGAPGTASAPPVAQSSLGGTPASPAPRTPRTAAEPSSPASAPSAPPPVPASVASIPKANVQPAGSAASKLPGTTDTPAPNAAPGSGIQGKVPATSVPRAAAREQGSTALPGQVTRYATDPASSMETLLEQSVALARAGKTPRATLPPEPMVNMPGIQKTIRDMPPATRKEVAKSNYRATKEGTSGAETAQPVYEAAGRANKATNMLDMLQDEGIKASQVARWNNARWAQEAKIRGIKPPSDKTIAEMRVQAKRSLTSKGKN